MGICDLLGLKYYYRWLAENNPFRLSSSQALQHLYHLLILNLNHNKITVIHNNAFEGLDTLEILTLYENKITQIDPEAFRGLEK